MIQSVEHPMLRTSYTKRVILGTIFNGLKILIVSFRRCLLRAVYPSHNTVLVLSHTPDEVTIFFVPHKPQFLSLNLFRLEEE